MKSITSLPVSKIKGLFLDLDGTLTIGPRLHASALAALEKLSQKKFWTVIVSGRPAGWADCLMRLTPIDAMVFENGAGVYQRDNEKLKIHPFEENFETVQRELQTIFQRLKRTWPQLRMATDQPFRLYDCAIDICEESPALSQKEVEAVLKALSQETGITAKLSSIHINFWKGEHDKKGACEYLLESEGKNRGIGGDEVIYVGDSPNDEPLFEFFSNSVGVANVRSFLDRLKHKPKYLTEKSEGSGFEELVRLLLN